MWQETPFAKGHLRYLNLKVTEEVGSHEDVHSIKALSNLCRKLK